MAHKILNVFDCNFKTLETLLNKYGLKIHLISDNKTTIPGSYWGDTEAGLIANTVYVRSDTPIHSLLHEACHYICMDDVRRQQIDTDAEGDYDEENGVCYLQILLAADIPEMGQARMLKDMDAWGYTFRLGSAKAWFNNDASDALAWLKSFNLLDSNNLPNYTLRGRLINSIII